MRMEENKLIRKLVWAIELWAAEEGGIPECAWDVYIRALDYLGVPYHIEKNDYGEPKIVFSQKPDDYIRMI